MLKEGINSIFEHKKKIIAVVHIIYLEYFEFDQ